MNVERESEPSGFTQAKRAGVIPLIGIFGKSGSGKTLSALKIARGIVGPSGVIAVTDTENRRASHFADDPSVAPYHVLDLQPPYGPEAYRACHEKAVKMGAGIHVIDSASHEWNGEGGCLQLVEMFLDDKAGNDWAKRDKFKMMAWAKVTPQHDLLVNALMRSIIPVICCFRAKDKIVMERQEGGPTKISTDADAPIARKDLVYEMLVALECHQGDVNGVQSGGYFHIRKPGPPSLHRMLLEFKDERLSPKIGELIASWCKAPIMPGTKTPSSSDEIKKLKKELWELTSTKHQNDKALLAQWLLDENCISYTEGIEELSALRLHEVIKSAKEKLK